MFLLLVRTPLRRPRALHGRFGRSGRTYSSFSCAKNYKKNTTKRKKTLQKRPLWPGAAQHALRPSARPVGPGPAGRRYAPLLPGDLPDPTDEVFLYSGFPPQRSILLFLYSVFLIG